MGSASQSTTSSSRCTTLWWKRDRRREVVLPVPALPHLSVLPATQDLVGAELQLVDRAGREGALRTVVEGLQDDYDYIVMDCPPSLGLLTLNVLTAANGVVIPIQCEYYGLEGISQLLNTVRLVQQNFNPGLAISGVLLTMYDSRLNLCRQVAEDAKEYFGAKVFLTPIPRNVRLAEAPSFGKPILLYDVQSVGAKSYLAVAQELMRAWIEHAGRRAAVRVRRAERAAPRAGAGAWNPSRSATGGDDMTDETAGRGSKRCSARSRREQAEASGALRELPVSQRRAQSLSAADPHGRVRAGRAHRVHRGLGAAPAGRGAAHGIGATS